MRGHVAGSGRALGKEPGPWGGGGTEAAPRQAESYWVWNREAAAAAPRGRGYKEFLFLGGASLEAKIKDK